MPATTPELGRVSVNAQRGGKAGEGVRGAGAIRAKDLDGVELSLLSNTVGARADGAGDVSAVAVAIGVGVVGKVGSEGSTATELLTTE
jgi:hypothetical protein